MTSNQPQSEGRLAWADHLSISFVPTDGLREPDPDRWVSIEADEGQWSRDWIDDEIDTIGTSESGEPMFIVEEHHGRTSWGADGAQLTYVAYIAEVLFEAAVGYGVGKFAEAMVAKAKARTRGEEFMMPLDEEDASYLARRRIAARYETDAEALVVTSVKTEGSEVTVALREPSGLPRYEIVYQGRGFGVGTLSCTRFHE